MLVMLVLLDKEKMLFEKKKLELEFAEIEKERQDRRKLLKANQ